MGQSQVKLASDIVEDEVVKETTLNVMRHSKSQNTEQNIDIEKTGGDVVIGEIDLDAAQTISVASVEAYRLSASNLAEISHKAADNLVRNQDSPFFQQDVLKVSDTIKSNMKSSFNMKNITKDIVDQLTQQKLIIKDSSGNVKIGKISFRAQATIVSKAFKSAAQSSDIGVKILSAMNLRDESVMSGPVGEIAALGKEFGLTFRQTMGSIAFIVGFVVLGSVIYFTAQIFGGNNSRIVYTNGELR